MYCHVSKRYPLNVDILGSWKFHYISWRDGLNQIPKIIVRYEDLINDTFQTMLKIITFLSSLINCKIDHEKIKFSIKQSSFQRLQKLENETSDESKQQYLIVKAKIEALNSSFYEKI